MTESEKNVVLSFQDARDLVDTKQRVIRQRIDKILTIWHQESIEELRDKARTGELEEAENDAIILANLKKELERLENLLNSK